MIAWFALGLALLNLAIFVALIVGVRHLVGRYKPMLEPLLLVGRYKPMLEPLLSMFSPPAAGAKQGGTAEAGLSPVPPTAEAGMSPVSPLKP